eukprot:TRINITY_DN3750_c1_g1_i1.p1 TRINITY_DN3750_c1_g1~~TRINITY_DN3750_c1_g1_i1.p1  ORF type:complete len:298 (+),score=93.90 TRINITY_DN3750_c1_g1_i1:39-896(+)
MAFEVSDEEIVQICNNFLLNSPPGEFMEVVTDIRGLLENDSIINQSAPATFREYNTEQMLQVQSPNGDHKVLVSKYGELSDSEYLDPHGKSVIQFDHIRQEVVGSRGLSGELDGDVEAYRQAFDDAASQYAAEHFVHGTAAVYGSKKGGNHSLTICISSSKFNPNNFWNGRWRSVWTASYKPGGQITLDGRLRVNVHYFEDGNVQLNTDVNKQTTANGANPAAAAAAAIKAIDKIEASYQTALGASYQTMGDTTFKALRRVLPITRTKIDWNKIRNYKIGGEMSR